MYAGQVRPSHGQGRYGVVPPRAPDIVDICVLKIRLPHHIISTRHHRRFSANAASVEEQGDDNCGSGQSRCVPSWRMTFISTNQGETGTPPSAARAGWEGGDRNGGLEFSK